MAFYILPSVVKSPCTFYWLYLRTLCQLFATYFLPRNWGSIWCIYRLHLVLVGAVDWVGLAVWGGIGEGDQNNGDVGAGMIFFFFKPLPSMSSQCMAQECCLDTGQILPLSSVYIQSKNVSQSRWGSIFLYSSGCELLWQSLHSYLPSEKVMLT